MNIILKILHPSVKSIDVEALNNIFLSGLDPNRSIITNGCTSLHLAAGIAKEETSQAAVRILMQHSANPNFPNNEGKTSLHVAASIGHQNVLQFLICNGGDVLLSDLKGNTSIDIAYLSGQTEVVSFLNLILDTEEYEALGENYTSFLWSRQLLEVSSYSISSIPMVVSCSICKETLLTKKDLTRERNSPSNIFESASSLLVNTSANNAVDSLTLTMDTKFDENAIFDSLSKKSLLQVSEQELSTINTLNIGFCCSFSNSSLFSEEVIDARHIDQESIESYCARLTDQNTSNESSGTFVTVVEEYVYKDYENKVEFLERRFPGSSYARSSISDQSSQSSVFYTPMSMTVNSDNGNTDENLQETLPESVINLSDKALRQKLKELGFDCGPVTKSTCKVLQKYYNKLKTSQKTITGQVNNCTEKYSKELEKFFTTSSFEMTCYELLDEKMSSPFINPSGLSWWRNGTQKTCFNYLLLDPRITTNLALRRKLFTISELFQKFLSAIFYIGKGTRSRPYFHLYEALSETSKSKTKYKVKKIKEIWAEELGVISLHIFQNTIPVEAWTREASMITAFGLDNLTNSIQGTFYGPASTWTKSNQRKLGSFYLFQAFNIIIFEGERQIRPTDIPIPNWNHK